KRQVNDYRDMEIGSSNKSYTLDIPLTPPNKILLKMISDIRSRGEVTDLARIVLDGIEAIRGKFRILSFTDLYAKAIVEADDWIDEIKGTSIKDLSWVGGDEHSFTAANILASWTAGAGAFYRYPLINYAELYSGEHTAGAKIYPYDFYPSWNIEDIVRKIFSDSGYTLASGSFFDGTFGQTLYIHSTPFVRNSDFIAGKNLKVYVNDNTDNYDTDTVLTGNNVVLTVNQVMVIQGEDEDEGSDFNTGTYRYVVPEAGCYRFQAYMEVWSDPNREPAKYTVNSNDLTWSIRKNGTPLETDTQSGVTLFNSGNSFDIDTGYIYLAASDYIDIHINMEVDADNDSPGTLNPTFFIDAGLTDNYLQLVWSEHNLWPGIGETMSPETHLPDIDTVSFLKALKEAYNLRFFMDRNNKTIYIETSDDFYGDTVVDWSDKIDYSEEPSFEIIVFNYKKKQQFQWKPDESDKAYSNYVSESGIPFQKILTLDSEYAKPGTFIRENSQFSPTILGNMNQIRHYDGKVPKILGSEEFVSSSRPYPPYRSQRWLPRIFEWKGMVALTTGSFNWYEDIEDTSGVSFSTFPSMETSDMSDVFDAYWLEDFRRIDRNKLATTTLKIKPYEFIPFTTVVGTAPDEGFRAKYLLNINGQDMYYIVTRITTDGDRVKCELMQKT
ncbi:hypothetical protein KA005_75180, partial [bacterium]|nr:hypothetical protein [bacterium]